MKFKPIKKAGGLLVELGPREPQLPFHDGAAKAAMPIFQLRKILVPVDFSDSSKKAVHYAAGFGSQFGAELTLIFVLQRYPSMLEMARIDPTLEAKLELEDLRKKIDQSVQTDAVLWHGVPHVEIVRVARELDADLIIL